MTIQPHARELSHDSRLLIPLRRIDLDGSRAKFLVRTKEKANCSSFPPLPNFVCVVGVAVAWVTRGAHFPSGECMLTPDSGCHFLSRHHFALGYANRYTPAPARNSGATLCANTDPSPTVTVDLLVSHCRLRSLDKSSHSNRQLLRLHRL